MRVRNRGIRFAPTLLLGLLAGCDRQLTEPAQTARAANEPAPLLTVGKEAIPGRYVVVLEPGAGSASATARELVPALGGRVHHTYEHAIRGFAATLTPASVQALRRSPKVRYVAEDTWSHLDATQAGATWGLDRIDQRNLPLSTTYGYTLTGAGVRVYVIDSGIRTTHAEFGGRASVGTDFIGDGRNGEDCNGHGTHVAGTIAGTTYGVAKGARVIAVRVFGCTGSTATSTIIAAVDWVTANAVKPAVANMSLGGAVYAPLNDAVRASINSGVTYVVAAGNDNVDACVKSPASTPEAITVGASTSADQRSSFSNWGTCVDVFAPGTAITSAWWQSDTQLDTINGTSMASPHAAGVAALYLQAAPTAKPVSVVSKILSSATANRLTGVGTGSPNALLFSPLTAEAPAPLLRLSPTALNLTVVRSPTGVGLASAPAEGAVAPRFTAMGAGAPRPAHAGDQAGTLDVVAPAALGVSSPLTLTNPGIGTLEWTAASSQGWLTVSPREGSLSASYTTTLTATVTPGPLPAGTHTAALTLTAAGAANSPQSLPVTMNLADALVLTPGLPRSNLSASTGVRRFFTVTVPAGATELRISLAGGSGDADLFVRYGDWPSFSRYDCASTYGGNSDACVAGAPTPGVYYVMVNAYYTYSGVTLAANIGGVPGAPGNLAATAPSATTASLTWTDGSPNESMFAIQRAQANGAGTWGAFATIFYAPANAVAYSPTGLIPGTRYRFRIRACNEAGCSPWSAVASATTPGTAPPTGVAATALTATSARVTWIDASYNETSFVVQRRLRNLDGTTWGAWADVSTRAANTVSFDNTGLLAGRTYQFQVRACTGTACSAHAVSGLVTLPASASLARQ